MELNSKRIRVPRWCLKPLRSLDAVLTTPNKRHHALSIEPTRVIDRLQKDIVQLIDLGPIFLIIARGLIDRLEGDQIGRAAQLRANLVPQAIEPFLDHGDIGSFFGDIGPLPRVCSCQFSAFEITETRLLWGGSHHDGR